MNFPAKYTTFHVTHTNPAAISLSLNRAESLYLNSLAEDGAAAVQDSRYRPKVEATRVVFESNPEPFASWPRP